MTCTSQTEWDLKHCASNLNQGEEVVTIEVTPENQADTICVDIPSEISANYRDLEVIIRGQLDSVVSNIFMTFNDDVGANYTSIASDGAGTLTEDIDGNDVDVFSLSGEAALNGVADFGEVFIANFSEKTRFKAFKASGGALVDNGTGNIVMQDVRGWWQDTDPITRLCFATGSGADFSLGTSLTVTAKGKK